MSKRTKQYLSMEIGLTLLSLAYTAWGISEHSLWKALIGGFVFGFHLTLTMIWGRKMRHENRRATENSGSTGPSSGPQYTSSSITRANITFHALGSAASIGAGTGLEATTGDEPFKAWKVAYVPLGFPHDNGWIKFQPVNKEFPSYGVDDVAQCARCTDGFTSKPVMVHAEKPPYELCSCGFYGLISKLDAITRIPYFHGWNDFTSGKIALLEVEFYGRVIVHTEGYRAEKQRVLSVSVLTDNIKQPIPPCETEWKWFVYPEEVHNAR